MKKKKVLASEKLRNVREWKGKEHIFEEFQEAEAQQKKHKGNS